MYNIYIYYIYIIYIWQALNNGILSVLGTMVSVFALS